MAAPASKSLLALALVLSVTACSTIYGVGKDISGAAEWTHDKIAKPQPVDAPAPQPAK